jgi:thioredoxin 2
MFNEAAEHHQPLFYCGGSPMSIVELNEETFQAAVEDGKPLIIDFWAPWCGPCRQFAPVFDAAAAKHPDVTFAKVNTEEEQELAAGLRIRSIPTLMVFRERVLLFSQAGALSAAQLDDLIEQVQAVDMEKVHAEIAAQQNQQPDQA